MLDICFGESECGMLKYALRKSNYGVTYSFCGLEFGKISSENFIESRKKWIDFAFAICSPKERAKILKEDIARFDEIIEPNWLHAIAVLRNCCAHHSRIWNRR